ncbi:phosphoribosyltransferase-like protein [Sphingobacterium bovistauri]|uniref:PRTase-CE domain-containing protein n=1 Tax=Sphingobacterium bovistauri TaxID=2781959 RepID=A0ABS7ZB58_9SPHI|nr:hypothetical protein [Sphingobacterium bovistauri]MCA5006115.1 hypothetical protein [Sphingobacterium bovistauri]
MFAESIERSRLIYSQTDLEKIIKIISENNWTFKYHKGITNLWNKCANDDEKNLIEELIHRFLIFTSDDIEDFLINMASLINDDWKLTPENTIISSIADDSKPDSSHTVIQSLKGHLKNKYRLFANIVQAAHEIKTNDVLIIVDDFVGSATSISSKVKYVKSLLLEKGISEYQIKFMCFLGMKSSTIPLDELGIEYFIIKKIKKGISDYHTPEISIEKKETMRRLESEFNIASKFSLGFLESEALFKIQSYNISNNVFPVFWINKTKDKKDFESIFRRG